MHKDTVFEPNYGDLQEWNNGVSRYELYDHKKFI